MLLQTYGQHERREDPRRMYSDVNPSDILRMSFGRSYNLVLTSSTIYLPTLKYEESKYLNFLNWKIWQIAIKKNNSFKIVKNLTEHRNI